MNTNVSWLGVLALSAFLWGCGGADCPEGQVADGKDCVDAATSDCLFPDDLADGVCSYRQDWSGEDLSGNDFSGGGPGCDSDRGHPAALRLRLGGQVATPHFRRRA